MPTFDQPIADLLISFGHEKTSSENEADFFMFSGGVDIDPRVYNAQRHEKVHSTNPSRDLREAFYFYKAKLSNTPCAGICRGFQFLCAMNGVKLIQHLEGRYSNHPITLVDTSFDKKSITVNSSHHQAVPFEATDALSLRSYAYSMDLSKHKTAIIEAGFSADRRFAGVQYHPEWQGCGAEGVAYFRHQLSQLLNNSN